MNELSHYVIEHNENHSEWRVVAGPYDNPDDASREFERRQRPEAYLMTYVAWSDLEQVRQQLRDLRREFRKAGWRGVEIVDEIDILSDLLSRERQRRYRLKRVQ